MKIALLVLWLAAPWTGFVGAVEVAETYRTSFGDYLAGRLDVAESGYRYLATLGVDNAGPTANLALLARDEGKPEEALPLWLKATLLEPTDAFLWSQRGWCYLSMGRYRDARDSFKKAVEVSSTPFHVAEADFGLGMTEALDANTQAAAKAFQGTFTRSPYLLPAAAAQLGRLASGYGKPDTAELYYRQSLDQDSLQPRAALELARLYEKNGAPKSAWQGYNLVLGMDPGNPQALKGVRKMAGFIIEKPERLLPIRRLVHPLMSRPAVPPESARLRVGLYADADGKSAQLAHFFFMASAGFKVVDVKLGEITRGKAFDQWDVAYRSDNRVVELRDVQRNLQFTTKQAFRLEPVDRGATILVKSADIAWTAGVDIGDREVRGAVEVVPSPDGFQLVNELGLEDYLYGVVASAMPLNSPVEALKAEAVFSRTKAGLLKPGAHNPFLRSDLCDSAHCQVYTGLTQENGAATQAVLATRGGTLRKGGILPEVGQHVSCGWKSEDGVEDRPRPLNSIRSPSDLERLTHGYPTPDLYCELSALIQPAWSRWVRVIDSDALRERLERSGHFIGHIENLRALRRSAAGRVGAVEVRGTRSSVTLEGPAVAAFLDPGGLRSTLFTLQPIYQGRYIRQLVVWGAGTGDGRGMCMAGALGQAHLGRKYTDILSHYFPETRVEGVKSALPPPAAERRAPEPALVHISTGAVRPQLGGGPSEAERRRARARRAARRRQAAKEKNATKGKAPE